MVAADLEEAMVVVDSVGEMVVEDSVGLVLVPSAKMPVATTLYFLPGVRPVTAVLCSCSLVTSMVIVAPPSTGVNAIKYLTGARAAEGAATVMPA